MLERIIIERFKSIRFADVSLGKVNLFVGANGTGKSNLLEAVGIVSAALGKGMANSDLGRKGVRLTPPEMMKSAHKNRDLPKTLSISAHFSEDVIYKCNLSSSIHDSALKFHSETASFNGKSEFGRGPRGNKVRGVSLAGIVDKSRGMWDQIKAAFPFGEEMVAAFSEIARYAIYSPQTDFLRGSKFSVADDPPIGLHGEGLPDAVGDLIRQSYSRRSSSNEIIKAEGALAHRVLQLVYLPGWTRGVRVGALENYMVSSEIKSDTKKMVYFLDKYMHDKRNKLSAYDSSEGTLFLLFAAVLLAHKHSPKYFALDNVDSALNPVMTRILVKSIIDITVAAHAQGLSVGPRQVLLTSHNPTSLDAFDIFDDSQRAFVVSRHKDTGDTLITRLEPKPGMTKTDWALASGGKKLSQLWLDGSIPGLSERDEF